MADVIFEDFTVEVQGAIDDKINIALEDVAGELEGAVKRRTRVDTGNTKNSWTHKVDTVLHEATVGSPLENAIWEEFGTGEFALAGNGRKGGWTYKDAKGNFYKTTGKTPRRSLHNAYKAMKQKIINHLQNSLKGL